MTLVLEKQETMKTRIITTVLAVFTVLPLFSQSEYHVSPSTVVSVDGTSNVHDWSATVENVEFEGRTSQTLEGLKVKFEVESMESGDRLMNRRIHSTLNSEDHPFITFTITDSNLQGNNLRMTGNLEINGVTKNIVVRATTRELSNGNVQISGSHPVLFTDHGMEAPSFMFGAMKVDNKVNIDFNVILIPVDNSTVDAN